MKKTTINLIILLSVIAAVWGISFIANSINPPYVYAFDPNYASGYTTQNLVNAMDAGHTSPSAMLYPPIGAELDVNGWTGGSYPDVFIIPTPVVDDFHSQDSGEPGNVYGSSLLWVLWSGNSIDSPQYVHLTNYASITKGYGMNFENYGCGGLTTVPSAGLPTTIGSLTETAGDWGCYAYIRFMMYFNFQANNGSAAGVSQRAALYDGNVTLTAGAVTVNIQGIINPEDFINHYTMSLNYLRNQYDTVSGRYFSVSNIADVIIKEPETDYSLWNRPAPGAFGSGWTSIIMYYDKLTLGAQTDIPLYDSPPGITVTTAYNGVMPIGAYIKWSPFTGAQPSLPVTAYHVYRKLITGTAGNDDPYVSVGIVPSGAPFLGITDTACAGGNVYCYKVLSCEMGPIDDNPLLERANTINATYHEPLLHDSNVNVARMCAYINPIPTNTLTPTISPTFCTSNCGTPTPTFTITPQPTAENIDKAHVYPNPYNPNATPGPGNTGGSGKFYVDNTPDGTEIHIYAMDGALVKEGTFHSVAGRFTWDGKNKNGSKVVSGLYYLVLQSPDKKTKVFRIIVCYKCDPVYHPQ
jgi:hypothetical protein